MGVSGDDAAVLEHADDGVGQILAALGRTGLEEETLVIFTNGDHGASAYRVLTRRLLGADPIAPEWV